MAENGARLARYLDAYGILGCNESRNLPSLSDIGCTWDDVTALIDAHALFYCKAFCGRTTYLSVPCYALLARCRAPRALDDDAARLFGLLAGGATLNTAALRAFSGLDTKAYNAAFTALLRELRVTALQNGPRINASWSSFYYGTAAEWERRAGVAPSALSFADARDALFQVLKRTVSEKDFLKLTGGKLPNGDAGHGDTGHGDAGKG